MAAPMREDPVFAAWFHRLTRDIRNTVPAVAIVKT